MFLFKQPEYKRFNIKPRYWDPEKEAREERVKRARAELGLKDEGEEDVYVYVPNVRGQFRSEYEKRKAMRTNAGSARTIRLFMILVILFLGAFYVFVKNPEGLLKLFGL